jgi:hypothetical protein
MVRYPYHSLEDSSPPRCSPSTRLSTTDGRQVPRQGARDRGNGALADITGFSARTLNLDPTETLAFVNHFFAWITAEALRGRLGIVDKYIGAR